MGVDVGGRLHVVVEVPSPDFPDKRRTIFIGTVPEFSDLDGLMRRFDVRTCVVDAQPEGHAARAFADRFPGRVWLCHYPDPARWPHKQPVVWHDAQREVSAHRTLTLDALYASIRERRQELPREVLAIPEFAEQLRAPVRMLETDATGQSIARYAEGSKADHYAMAANYCRIAAMRPAGARAPGPTPSGSRWPGNPSPDDGSDTYTSRW
jgi:hypothetical protein